MVNSITITAGISEKTRHNMTSYEDYVWQMSYSHQDNAMFTEVDSIWFPYKLYQTITIVIHVRHMFV